MGRVVHRDSISPSVLVLCSAQQTKRNNVKSVDAWCFNLVLLIGGQVWLSKARLGQRTRLFWQGVKL